MTVERHPITDRKEWLDRRRHDLTASEIGAAAGCSPYKTPLEVYGEKKGWLRETADNAAMQRGRLLEKPAMEMLQERRPEWTIFQPNIYMRDPLLRLGGTVDGIASTRDGDLAIEVKSMMESVFDRDWQDGPPLYVELQDLCNAMLWGAHAGVVVALVIDRWANLELYTFDVPRHAEAEHKIQEIARRFWHDFDAGIEPRADYKRDAEVLAQIRKPVHSEPTLDLSADNRLPDLLEERANLITSKNLLDDRLDEIKAELVDKMAGYRRATVPGWKLSNTMSHRAEHLVRAADYAVLRVTKEKDL